MIKGLIDFLNDLEENSIHYELTKVRHSIMVKIAVPGERWEVEFFEDGSVEIEKFISEGIIRDNKELKELFEKFSD